MAKSEPWNIDPAFGQFWAAYPRKEDKPDAWKAWRAAIKVADPSVIIAGLLAHEFSAERQYQKLPAGWLRGRRWGREDDTPPPTVALKPRGPRDGWLDQYDGARPAREDVVIEGRLL